MRCRDACLIALILGRLALGGPLNAQSRSVGFLPGLGETYAVWTNAGTTLAATFNISPFYAPLATTTQSIEAQSGSLGSLAGGTFLVGHSAGGDVARYYAQHATQPLGGLITVGTPNYGAPIVQTYPVFCQAVGGTTFDVLLLGLSIDPISDQWIIDELEPDYDWGVALMASACDVLAPMFTALGTPAAAELAPNSGFLATLNSNTAAEAANAGTEVSVVVTTENFYHAGWIKAWLQDDGNPADAYGYILDGLAGTMAGLSEYLDMTYPGDPHFMDVSDHLLAVADDILFLDEIWCESVGGTLFYCLANDETVPTYSQNLGRGTIFPIADGPVHSREAQDGGGILPGPFSAAGIPSR